MNVFMILFSPQFIQVLNDLFINYSRQCKTSLFNDLQILVKRMSSWVKPDEDRLSKLSAHFICGEHMKSSRSLSIGLVAAVAMLFQTVVFAIDYRDPAIIESNAGLKQGYTLPVLHIQEGGEIHVSDNNIIKRPWSSSCFDDKGKVQVVQYIAANFGVRKQNKAFNDSLVEKRFTSEQMSTTIIVNMADTMEMAKGMVMKKLAKSKAEHHTIDFVIDDHGVGLQRWGMKNKSSAVIVLDQNGRVLFAKDGPLSDIEIEATIRLIEAHMS